MPKLTLNEDRLFPAESTQREIARRIYSTTKDLPIISPHGHVPPSWFSENTSFGNPAQLLLTPDHYINRIMHANGVELSQLGVGREEMSEEDNRNAWRTFCAHWSDYNGTAMRYWMTDQLVGIFGVTERPSPETADVIYDQIQGWIDDEAHRPRELMDKFNIEFIATTDDPCGDLADHQAIHANQEFSSKHRVVPTFRPDKYLEPGRADWNELVNNLGEVSEVSVDTLSGFTEAMENRRAYFKENGAISTDHSHADLQTNVVDRATAENLYQLARTSLISPAQATELRRFLLVDQIRMASEDGLTMTLHPAVVRNHDPHAFAEYGADVGGDIPYALEVTRSMQPALAKFGNHPNLKLVLFTLDEDVFSREIAPLAGYYRSLYIGVPWWFIDAPESILRYKQSVTEMAGFSRTSGMIDDTRAFCSIPARHDMSRRLDAVHLASLVATHRLDEDEAIEQARRLVVDQPKKVFNL